MKTIIAGSRNITDYGLLEEMLIKLNWDITEVVSGGAKGVDALGEEWGKKHNLPVTVFPADWDTYGKSAGPRRNIEMASYADALVAIWDGVSRGTAHMIKAAKSRGLKVYYTSPGFIGCMVSGVGRGKYTCELPSKEPGDETNNGPENGNG